ncbi:MAG: DUF4349 domain-containing protein, partial [Actinomycetota bacterium]
MKRIWMLVLALAVVASGAAACSGADSGDGVGGSADAGGSEKASLGVPATQEFDEAQTVARDHGAALGGAGGGASGATGGGDAGYVGAASALPKLGPSVIKTGDVEIEIDRGDFQSSMQRIVGLADRYGGFVLSSSTDGDRARSGTVVLRVPAEDFERALADLKGLGRVTHETVSGEDVGEEFVDLQA